MKKIKMMLYGTPGVGKSVFALSFPKPFFITTDGNYEWLEDFGAKEEDHKQVKSYKEFVSFIKDNSFDKYDTVVVDLVEDLFKWCEDEYCKKNRLDYIGDLSFGKGFKITRDDFFIEISKLLALEKNIVLLSHESYEVVKDKRGVESTIYSPSKLIPDKLRDAIEGRLRYVLRAKFEDHVGPDNRIRQRRVLSLAKDSSEFSIIRGINMDKLTEVIDLDFKQFVKELKLEKNSTVDKPVIDTKPKEIEKPVEKPAVTKSIEKPIVKVEPKIEEIKPKVEPKIEVKVVEPKATDEDDLQLFKVEPSKPVEKPAVVEKETKEVKKESHSTDKTDIEKLRDSIRAKIAALSNNK